MLNTKPNMTTLNDKMVTNDLQNGLKKNNQTKISLSNKTDNQRNRRMLANIQATLGGTINLNKKKQIKSDSKQEKYAFNNIFEVLERIQLADNDVQISLTDIRSYLLANEKSFNKKDYGFLCSTFCKSALLQSNSYYIVDLCVELISNQDFLDEMIENLSDNISTFIDTSSDNFSEIETLPNFLAQLAVAKWPRGRDKAIENLNPILYTVINTVMGWIQYITESTEKNEDDLDSKQYNLLVRCIEGLCSFCMVGQRSLWLNFPEMFDDIYQATKNILISNIKLNKSLKSSVLQLHLLLNKWSICNTPKYSTISTQTISKF